MAFGWRFLPFTVFDRSWAGGERLNHESQASYHSRTFLCTGAIEMRESSITITGETSFTENGGGEYCKYIGLISRPEKETTVELGWNLGYVSFTLSTVSKNEQLFPTRREF